MGSLKIYHNRGLQELENWQTGRRRNGDGAFRWVGTKSILNERSRQTNMHLRRNVNPNTRIHTRVHFTIESQWSPKMRGRKNLAGRIVSVRFCSARDFASHRKLFKRCWAHNNVNLFLNIVDSSPSPHNHSDLIWKNSLKSFQIQKNCEKCRTNEKKNSLRINFLKILNFLPISHRRQLNCSNFHVLMDRRRFESLVNYCACVTCTHGLWGALLRIR